MYMYRYTFLKTYITAFVKAGFHFVYIRMLIDEYLSPSNLYLVTSPHHNHSVRSTPENRLMALEIVTHESGSQLSSFNRNIIQICLYLEGIGTFAKVRL